MGDFYQYEMSNMSQGGDDSPFTSKNWVFVNDTNQGSYGANSVTFDLSTLYNSQKFIGVNEMELVVPLVMVLSKSAEANDLVQNDYAMALKNGFYNIIDSLSVVYDGQTVVQQCNHSNFYTSFKINSSISTNDLQNICPSIGVYPDSATSWQYSQTANVRGVGLTNNLNDPSVQLDLTAISTGLERYNKGMFERQKRTSIASAKFNPLTPAGTVENAMRNTTAFLSATQARQHQVYYITATIRLSDVCSFFSKMGLTRGFYGRLTFNLNMGSCRIVKTALTSLNLNQGDTNFPYQTCPFMISPLRGASGALSANTNFTEIVCGIYVQKVTASVNCVVNHSTLGVVDHKLGSCRIYAPQYEMKPEKALQYIQANRSKYIEYEDLQYTPLSNIVAGSAINFNITNSALDPLMLLVIPMISGSVNSVANQILYPHSSPFTCEPSCTSPVMLSQFNIQVAGCNVFPNNMNYDFEMFNHELLGVNSINGSGSLGLSSGLIDATGFENIYRYYVVNLERRVSNKAIPVSISISAQQCNSVPIDLHIFVVTRKSVVIDCESGKLQSMAQ